MRWHVNVRLRGGRRSGIVRGMSTKLIEQELADLKKRVKQLEAKAVGDPAWLKHAGWAKDDPIYDEAMKIGAEWRAKENRKSLRNAGGR